MSIHVFSPSFPQETQSSMQTFSVSGWGSAGPFVSVIIFLHEADDGGTQMLTKSPGISSSAGKW